MLARLDLYRPFYYAAKNRSFSKAAEELFMTQSAVSQSIKALERELAIPLFLRAGGGVTLTAEGEILYEYVRNALSLLETAQIQLNKIKKLELGELRIGVGDTISRYLLLPYLDQFHKQYPKVKLQIINRTSLETVALLKAGRVDLAFVNLPLKEDLIEVCHYLPVHDIFVAGNRFSMLRNAACSPEEIAAQPLILLERLSNSRNYIDLFFLKKGIRLLPEIELGSHDLLLEFAKIDLGVACVIKEFSQTYLDSGALFEVRLTTPIPPRGIGVCTLKGVSVSLAGEAFLKLMFGEEKSKQPS